MAKKPRWHVIDIEVLAEKADPFIHSDDKWDVSCSLYGTITPVSGKESVEGTQTKGQVTHKIEFRWGPSLEGFTTADRIRFRDRVFELDSVMNVGERNERMVCMAIERG